MIAAWMIYTAAVTLLLFVGAAAAEYVARAIATPTRFVWLFAILCALGLSARALIRAPQHAAPATTRIAAGRATPRGRMVDPTALPPAASVRWTHVMRPDRIHRFINTTRGAAAVAQQSVVRIDVALLDRWNAMLIAAWALASCGVLCWLGAALRGLRRIERDLAPGLVDGQPVLLSGDFGPALVGVVRARIVIPRWTLALPRDERSVILAHEREHAAACDPIVLFVATLAVALQPWNVVLWALLLRLKLAVEGDCDRRVLGTAGTASDARYYGNLLIAVYERTMPQLTSSHVAFVKRPSNLERRILRMTRRPRLRSIGGAAAIAAALVTTTAAWSVASPVRSAIVNSKMHARPSRARNVVWQLPAVRTTAPRTLDDPPSLSAPTHDSSVAAKPASMAKVCAWPIIASDGVTELMPSLPRPGCAIDGDVVVFALDSSRVLIAGRDTSESGAQMASYTIFTATPGTVPAGLAWSTHTGHIEMSGDGALYVASSSPEAQPVVLDFLNTEMRNRHPNALAIKGHGWAYVYRSSISWDRLAKLSTSPRCPGASHVPAANGLLGAGADGRMGTLEQSRVDRDRDAVQPPTDCFVVDGQVVRFP